MTAARDDAGLYIGYLDAFADVDQVYSSAKAGTVHMNAYSLWRLLDPLRPAGLVYRRRASGTWFGQVEGSTPLTGMTVSGSAFTASLEAGDPFHLAPSWTLEPQAQLIYQYAQMGSGADIFGHTSFGDTDDLRGRIGAKLSYVVLNGFATAPRSP